ncbi:FGFR1 oncoprotein partner [Cichlidogyrus casuarinus]|uniref:FGFR1 oncoprotein partner n=1 Tax=Cichlidogyrus casuarinus TaxID=1844966 RepID=A0ABD2Q990_9PLAT
MAENDLKDLLIQQLDECGLLAKLQAQLKAGVYVALESHEAAKKLDFENKELKKFASSPSGIDALSLIKDALKQLNLESTLQVFENEIHGQQNNLKDRQTLSKYYKIDPKDNSPLLSVLCNEFNNIL